MEKIILQTAIPVFFIEASSYPGGIIEAFQKLERLHPSIVDRPFFGLSHEQSNGTITYKAAVEESYAGEGKKYGCEIFEIEAGPYLSATLFGYLGDINAIPELFKKLTAVADYDPAYPCIEWYKSAKELRCMTRLKV